MARQRKPSQVESSSDSTTTNDTKESTTMTDTLIVLDDDAIAALLAGSRSHGSYDVALGEFLDSDSKGIQINTAEGTFSGKKEQSLKTGFESAKKRRAEKEGSDFNKDDVKVIVREGKVFLVRPNA